MNRIRRTVITAAAICAVAMTGAWGRTRVARTTAKSPWADTVMAPAFSVGALDSLLSTPEACGGDTAPDAPSSKPQPLSPAVAAIEAVMIMGEPEIEVEQMWRFVQSRNADFPREIAEAFYNVGRRYGVRGDIALCQSILETGWFKFTGGTAVTPDQHNYCGLGVTRLGVKGSAFDTVEQGVTAQIQHLYAYACTHSIPEGETLLDPRFKLVPRGVAPTWDGLNGRWAANNRYSERILRLFAQMRDYKP